MMEFQAVGRQLFGEKYRGVRNSVYTAAILFISLRLSGFRGAVSPRVLFLTAFVFSAGIMWENLSSKRSAEHFEGLFSLPFEDGRLKAAIVSAFAAFTLLSRSLPVLALFYALSDWKMWEIALSLFFAAAACVICAAWFALLCGGFGRRMRLLRFSTAVLWAAAAISGILFLGTPVEKAAAAAVCLCPALPVLRRADCYVFLRSGISGRGPGRRYGGANVIRYFFRVLRLNPAYARNTLFLGLFACALPFLPGQAAMPGMLPIGFAVLSLNTPVCTMLSADPDTDMNVRMLPSQRKHFLAGYCLFIFLINAGLDCVYLISWQIVCGGLVPQDLLTAALFALQSAMFSAALEWRFPLRDWRTETDLWHHPRKYLVPAIMILIAGGIMILKAGIWLWLLLLLPECALFALYPEDRMSARWKAGQDI